MYAPFFNLREMPFAITPDPAYLFLSQRHQEALGHLLYGTGQYGGFVQLTGEVGTGKTTIIRTLLEQKLERVDVAMIHNPRQSELEFVQSICDELGVDYAGAGAHPSLKQLVDALNRHLLHAHAQGRRTVLIIDEAQNLPRDVLEQVRLLTNLETHKEKLLRIMLIGQPELSDLLARPDLRQLASRITARCHLTPLSAAETGEYIRHRLQVAGGHEELFTPAAVQAIHEAARGVPRMINVLCDRALLGAYSQGQRRVLPATVQRAAIEAFGAPVASAAGRGRWRWRMPPLRLAESALAVLALLISAALLYRIVRPEPAAEAPAATAATPAADSPTPVAAPVASPAGATTPPSSSAPRSAARTAPASTGTVASPRTGSAGTAPTVPAATAAATDPTPAPAAVEADLTALLQASQPLSVVMSRLIRLWDREAVLPAGAQVCRELARYRLECFRGTGEWADLRSLNRPALLALATGRGEQQHVLLRSLTANFANIDAGSGNIAIPLSQLDALWTGEYLLIWKREIPESLLNADSRGKSVIWLRQRLAEFAGEPLSGSVSDRYDAALTQQVRSFQARRGLEADGLIGLRTLIALGDPAPGTPLLASLAP